MKIVAVTSCPTGIAHTYMAAEALEKAAKARGHEIVVETQGSAGADTAPASAIRDADVLILAADATVHDLDRFSHLPEVRVGVADAINRTGEVLDRAERMLAGAPAAASGAQPAGQAPAAAPDDQLRIVAVTSCPTGIAHTYMAAEALEKAAKARGYHIVVETQGSGGAEKASEAAIRDADVFIRAADATVHDVERFAHLPKVEVGVADAINRTDDVLDRAQRAAASRAVSPEAPNRVSQEDAPTTAPAPVLQERGGAEPTPTSEGAGAALRRWLMTGVSYMIPFVTAGGILIALAFAFGGAVEVTEASVFEEFTIPRMLNEIGGAAFGMLVPILAGFIAYAMADRPGIAPGVVGGLLAINENIQAGFLGGIVAGLLAGGVVLLIKKLPVPASLRGLMPVLIYPLFATLVVGALMITVVGQPLGAVQAALTDALEGMQGANAILLGIILGAMMAFDMGGPVNKVAYAFGLGTIASGIYEPHAAVMAAGMTPPLGLALATTIARKRFTAGEREAGKAAWVMGASFITEGAIPFAAADPLRVIPALVIGSATAGGLSMAFGATLQAPHGGLFVVGLVGNAALYILAIVIGTVVTALLVNLFKSLGRSEPEAVTTGSAA